MDKGTRKAELQREVRKRAKPDATIITDELKSYSGLAENYQHLVVNHAEKHVDGMIHTNGLENFWSLLKRSLGGTYVSVRPFHLFRYLDEQAYATTVATSRMASASSTCAAGSRASA